MRCDHGHYFIDTPVTISPWCNKMSTVSTHSFKVTVKNLVHPNMGLSSCLFIPLRHFLPLSGLQDLIGLRELDLANNCLCCHDDLEPLRSLKRLREVGHLTVSSCYCLADINCNKMMPCCCQETYIILAHQFSECSF